jgi:hypothetical protein
MKFNNYLHCSTISQLFVSWTLYWQAQKKIIRIVSNTFKVTNHQFLILLRKENFLISANEESNSEQGEDE